MKSDRNMSLFNKYIGSRVKQKRKEAKITQEDLATAIGKSRPTMCHYEEGYVAMTIPIAYLIAEFLKIKITDIFPETLPSQSQMIKEIQPKINQQ